VRLQYQPQVDAAITLLYQQMDREAREWEEAEASKRATVSARSKLNDLQQLNGERRRRLEAAQASHQGLKVSAAAC
jgi:hypothetical protein